MPNQFEMGQINNALDREKRSVWETITAAFRSFGNWLDDKLPIISDILSAAGLALNLYKKIRTFFL